MAEERRRFMRFELPMGVELTSQGQGMVAAATKDVSREGVSIIAKNFDFQLHNPLSFQLTLPDSEIRVTVLGNIMWKRQVNDAWQAGIKFTAIDKITKGDLLSYAYDRWVQKVRSQKFTAS